ncbi:hypothetical protein HT031_002063 [Scenedesmus sp. PABB004]|nr:hypothetical protein HT031_002063 [Scenedesmus sp. PABB004]
MHARLAPQARQRGGAAAADAPARFSIHGRHVTITPPLEAAVRAWLAPVLDKLRGARFVEGEGGVADVDVRLMNTEVAIALRPAHTNCALHATLLRMGVLKARARGAGLHEALDRAVASLEGALHRYAKPPPRKRRAARH